MSLFLRILEKKIQYGQLTVLTPDGKTHRFGNSGPRVTWNLHDNQTIRRISRNWEFELGETYIHHGWDVTHGSLYDLLAILRSNFSQPEPGLLMKPVLALLSLQRQWNTLKSSLANVTHHYDLDAVLFRDFLDEGLNYSCAYHRTESMSLEEAQVAKCEHIARKLLLKPGHRVLDIGCGWGSLAIYLAEHYDVEVTGITLSAEQLKVAQERSSTRNLQDRVKFRQQDYRTESGCYDRIVSVRMFEHVGRPNYLTFFKQLQQNLVNDGIALVHTIGRSGEPGHTNAWIAKYIFPGGYVPALSEITQRVEKTGLMIADVEVLRRHYNQTLSAWTQRFLSQRSKFATLKSEKFCRIWEFYLAISEVVFVHSDTVVFQLQFSKQHGAVPITRDYLYDSPTPKCLSDDFSRQGAQ